MKKYIFPAILILGYLGYKWYQLPGFSQGDDLPDFSATLLDGKEFTLSDLRGDYILVDFWGSWCGPCRKENPELVKLYHEYKDSSVGFHIVSVAIETKKEKCVAAIKEDGLVWPYHIVLLDRFQSELAKTFKVREIPTKYLLSKEGSIISVNPSFEEIRQVLNQ